MSTERQKLLDALPDEQKVRAIADAKAHVWKFDKLSLVMGIMSIMGKNSPIFAIVLGVLGVALALQYRKGVPNKLSMAGMILSFLGIALAIASMVLTGF